jgi:ribonucleotide reductase beta subunit family protein with ferritin-like domain
MNLVGNEYRFHTAHTLETLPAINIETLSEEAFDEYVLSIHTLNENEKKRIENENKQREAESKRLTEEAEKLAAQKAEIENEMKALTQERLDARIVVLESLGLIVSQISPFIFYKSTSLVTTDELRSLSVADWAVKLSHIKEVIADIDKSIAEHEELAKINAELLVKAKLDKEAEDARLAEIERVSNLDDKDKYLDYVAKINAIPKPELKTAKWKKVLNSIIIPNV